MKALQYKDLILNGGLDDRFERVYGDDKISQRERYAGLIDDFCNIFSDDRDIRFFSAPGRTEIGGNHTDHNHGKVLAASINLDVIAVASANSENIIRVKSRGFDKTDVVDITKLSPLPDEVNHSAALIRGVAARFVSLGYKVGGFDAATVSQVLSGSGLSSSAAFEVLIGTILNYLYNDGKVSAVEIAQIAQYSENVFYGKPCGLMDQTACSVGSFVEIDFADPSKPVIEPLKFDFATCGHKLCIVDTRADHTELSDEYGAIRKDMESVAHCFDKTCLREVEPSDFYKNIADIRKKTSDKAVVRAMHFYADNARVDKEAAALTAGDFETFKANIIESGCSSFMYNQNVNSVKMGDYQPVGLALALSESVLKGKGAWRVHGGGFAGTIQAFVPDELLSEYISVMNGVFGDGATYVLSIRPVGGTEI